MDMKNARFAVVIALFSLAVLAGCNSSAPKPAAENKPAETKPAFRPTYLTGREALQKMYVAARAWAPDVKPYSLQSIPTKGNNGQDGKSGIWGAGFASASRKAIKVFTWSGLNDPNAPEPGVSNRPEDTYNPANTSTAAFDMAFLKIDSGAAEGTTPDALKVAEKHGGDKLPEKNKDINVFYSLSWNPRENKLVWRVAFGEQPNQPKLAVDVDASTGTFMKVEK